MLDIILIIFGILFMFIGLAGCILPILPGPPLCFIGILMLHFTKTHQFSATFLTFWAVISIAIIIIDNLIPVWGTKKFGGSKKAIWGSMIGIIAGMFVFPPFGIIIGSFVGAVIGEMIDGKDTTQAIRAGFGSFIGFLGGTLLKLIVSGFLLYYFFKELIF